MSIAKLKVVARAAELSPERNFMGRFHLLLAMIDALPADGVVVPRETLERLRSAQRAWDQFGGPHAAADECGNSHGPCTCGLCDAEETILEMCALLKETT